MVAAVSPERCNRSIWPPPPLTNSWLTSSAVVTSMTRWRSPLGRKTARCRPAASRSSRCTPVRLPPSAPMISPMRLSRSAGPRPEITDSRGWRSSVNVPPPASMITRWHFTILRIGRVVTAIEPNGPGRAVARMPGRLECTLWFHPAGFIRRHALLAQSAEHSHGKAGVVGSIPTEGSRVRGRSGSGAPGGVAQLVRALGS